MLNVNVSVLVIQINQKRLKLRESKTLAD